MSLTAKRSRDPSQFCSPDIRVIGGQVKQNIGKQQPPLYESFIHKTQGTGTNTFLPSTSRLCLNWFENG